MDKKINHIIKCLTLSQILLLVVSLRDMEQKAAVPEGQQVSRVKLLHQAWKRATLHTLHAAGVNDFPVSARCCL